jgi:hypothetical protein
MREKLLKGGRRAGYQNEARSRKRFAARKFVHTRRGAGEREAIAVKGSWRNPRGALALLLALAVALAYSASWRKSVTVDEYTLVPEGLAILRTGLFHLDDGVPPLGKLLSALPLLGSGAQIDAERVRAFSTGWDHAALFADMNADRYHGLFVRARAASALGLVALGLLTHALAQRLYGSRAALIAVLFTVLCPNLLAHAGLATADVFFTAAFAGVCLALDRLLVAPSLRHASWLGLALGVSVLLKFTGMLLCAFVPLIAIAAIRLPRSERAAAQRADPVLFVALLVAAAVGVAVIHAGYLGAGSFTAIGEYRFAHPRLQWLQALFPRWLPIPLPYHFLKGIDTQLSEGGYVAYLMGELSSDGFAHYYLVALVSIGLRPRPSARELAPLALATALVAFFSLAGHKNIGVRYVLFVYPALALSIARIAPLVASKSPRTQRAGMAAIAIGALATCVEAVTVWPDYLPYFNQAVGGASGGHRILLDSNLDWGQDLPALADWQREQGVAELDLAYCGRVKPELYGIHYRSLLEGRQNRYAAISANFLYGRMYFANGGDTWILDPDYFAAYRRLRPIAVLGHSIYVFDHDDWDSVRAQPGS